jgi:small-conductance mechanosensitive channel
VVNEIEIADAAIWNLAPAIEELQDLTEAMIRRTPIVLIALVLSLLTWYVAKWSVRAASSLFGRRLKNHLLRDVAARAVAVPVFMLGLFVVLTVSGLTGLAVTVIGGTGLLGLVIGFAFRDIAENFLASVLISMQRPFATNDLIEVAGYKGFVQSVNTRATLLMTLDGNHVQIPNATIYKATITNFTANPIARYDFSVGIGYDDSIALAQAEALRVLQGHPAVMDDPEPLVLVESLGAATVNLRIYFWVDIARYSNLKVRSAVIRLTKRAFLQAGISLPDEAREVIFPQGVQVQMVEPEAAAAPTRRLPPARIEEMAESVANSAEGELVSEAGEIKRQARESRKPEGGANLLES